MSVARILPDSGIIELVRAGHCPGILIRPDRPSSERSIEVLPKGIGLALASEAVFEPTLSMERVKMFPGEVLALFSDGLTEARDPEGEEIGQDRLARLLERNVVEHSDSDLRLIGERLVGDLALFSGSAPQHDDVTLFLIRWGSLGDTLHPDEQGTPSEATPPEADEQTNW
jgi:sigma-B regulation protein RsbU (phosphoserine phosphatase)